MKKAETTRYSYPGAREPAPDAIHPVFKRAGSQPSGKGPADRFTGTVRIDPLFTAPAPGRAAAGLVTFGADARTAWHTQALGQTLIVTAGSGRVQREGGKIEESRPGDVISFAPGEKPGMAPPPPPP